MSLLKPSPTYKPFNYPWAVDLAKKHEEIHWTEDEADLSEDVTDWKLKLSASEKDFITQVLRLFTQTDVQVGNNYHDFLIPKIKNNEIRVLLTSFAGREGTHQRAYALLNDTLGLPDEEYHKFLEYTEMVRKVEFMQDNRVGTKSQLALALAQSVFNEGVSLFSSFVMLLNFQRFGKMKGMGTIVEWSIRDESMHVEGNAAIFKQLLAENREIINDEFKSKIYTMATTVVELEIAFINLAFNNFKIQGLTTDEVITYVKYLADRRLIQLGLKPIFLVKDNPLTWLDWILNGVDHSNFFEKRVTEYSVNGMSGEWNWDSING